ncbi:regulator of Vps4 activity in the MVB pathway-domain-containing protein [Lentinula aff. detonsa]|uniref:Regulator of Vps4 activity in the MVB pathway-domain-containing protein n=1 Tax=Lentinula aff. detonsa TaxID=2804958 RepID=A0AA38NPQ7_9AGAR|nr:regulator of Vps4 activity in the MVB pathway-domain-containing protein [Lentinula aff. detonsa]
MALAQWELTSAKAQLRLASQRLGHLQEKNDSRGSITRRDIATLLQQGNAGLARVKAQNLYQDDIQGDAFEVLEMHVGVVLEHILELEHNSPGPAVIEAASSIIYASARVESKDLQLVRDLLVNRLGSDFVRASVGNRDRRVSDRIVKDLTAPPPNATQIDTYLLNIAKAYGVQWQPDPLRQDIVGPLSEILDLQSSPLVDLANLRRLCARGIPDEPATLRPRIWRALLGTLPVLKASWSKEASKQRESYYDLVRQLLEPFENLPDPTTPLSSLDLSLIKVAKQLSGIPSNLFHDLQEEPEPSELCPLDGVSPDHVKISCSNNLSARLQVIQKHRQPDSSSSIPEIRLESDAPDDTSEGSAAESRSPGSMILHASNALGAQAHEKHTAALLRLLYLHSAVNPGNLSPHIPALLLPLYSVLNQEVEPEDFAHVEADTFWLFEAMVGEFSELEDEEGGNTWMRKFSERLTWADSDLRDNLFAKGLDPALPHYSYRWLAPLLTQTLPLSAVIVVWDALFACQMRDRQNSKLEFLVDVCTAMLLRAKVALLKLGKSEPKSPSLWTEEAPGVPLISPLRPWELSDAFVQGVALLQHYPIQAAGGIDSVLQTASELRHRREDEAKFTATNSLTFGDRLRLSVWKGFTNQQTSPERSPSPSESSEEDQDTSSNVTETQEVAIDSGLTSRLATTVWRGITNQSAMEPPPSPLSPITPSHSPGRIERSSPVIVVNDTSESDVQEVTIDESTLTGRLTATVWRGITNRTAMEPPRSPHDISRPSTPSTPHTPSSPSIVVTDSEPTASTSKGWPSSTSLWNYAEKLKESNAAATLSKVSSNWQAKALAGSWSIRKSGNTSSHSEQPQVIDSLRHSDPPQNFWFKSSENRRTSVPDPDRSGVYSPPARPAFFKPPRDTVMFTGNEPIVDVPNSPELSPSSEGGLIQKTKSLQASLAALTRGSETTLVAPATPQPKPKSGPRPLLLGSTSVITPRGERPISRSENSTPLNAPAQWNDVLQSRDNHAIHRDSLSSISSLSPSDALTRGKMEYDSDSPAPVSRKVALNRRSISPMAPHSRTGSIPAGSKIPPVPHFRTGSIPHLSLSSSSGSSAALASPMTPLKSSGWGQVHTPESPPAAPDGLHMRSPSLASSVHTIIPEEHSLEKAPSADDLPLEPPLPSRKLARKRTPPPPGDTSDSSVPELPRRNNRVRTKRNVRPPNLRLQHAVIPERVTTSPNSLAVEWPFDEQELATTPRASSFSDANNSTSPRSPRRARKISTERRSPTRQRKTSGEGQEPRSRKTSNEMRTRKVSDVNNHRDSAADMGDDEGYDELLSAYSESEDSSRHIISDD